MWPLIGAVVGAGTGLIKYGADKDKEGRQRRLAAETARYSPWTGLTPDMKIQRADMLGNVTAGAMQGASFGMSNFGGGGAGAGAAGAGQGAQPSMMANSIFAQDEYPELSYPGRQNGRTFSLGR